MSETETNMLPTPEQLFAEAMRVTKDELHKAHYDHGYRSCQMVWYWYERDRDKKLFGFSGYVSIVITSYEKNARRKKGVPWIQPDTVSINYHENRGGYYTVLRFRMHPVRWVSCARQPDRTLSVFVRHLNLYSAMLEQTSPGLKTRKRMMRRSQKRRSSPD